ncbi:unnamed protein product [Oikopleura dioica]|uniref:Uncharacterized protein n=1 Tax=Oikopleura dioica TaxID=34765 RepID=E4WYJ1_OIKDI|nr:unnamed protein product [Oikopleura dioica]
MMRTDDHNPFSRSLNFIRIQDLATPRSRRRKFYESLDLSADDKPNLPKYTPMSARMVESSSPLFKSIKPSLKKKEKLVIPRKIDEQRLIELAQPKTDHRPDTPPNMPNPSHVFVSEKIIELAKPKKLSKGYIGQRESSVNSVPRTALKLMPSNHAPKLASSANQIMKDL